MLVTVTRRAAQVSEERVELAVGNDADGEVSVEFEPLRAFSPVGEFDVGLHLGVVAASAGTSRVVKGAEEAEIGVYEIGVDGREVEERNAGFGKEDESLVGQVEKRVCKKASLCVDHRYASPVNWLH